MTLSRFMYVMDINWINVLWGVIWIISFAVFFAITFRKSGRITGRKEFIKNELPQLHNNMVGLLQAENKKLKTEIKKLENENRNYYDRLCVIKNSSAVQEKI